MNTTTMFGLTGNEIMVAGVGALLLVVALIGMALGRRNGSQDVVRQPARRLGCLSIGVTLLLVLLFINFMVPGGLYALSKMTGGH